MMVALCSSLTVLAQDATTPTSTSVTCCTVRVHELQLNPGMTSARVVVLWFRSDGSVHEERAWGVTDGEDTDVTDNFLWGNGLTTQPFGLMRRVSAAASEEAGTLPARTNKAILRWLRTTGRIGATELTIP